MSSVAIERGTAPPGFFRVLWELIVGYLFAFFALLVPVFGLAALGVFDWHGGFHGWPLRGPFPPIGVWAISADLFCALVVVCVSTFMIAGSMQAALQLPVSRPVVALVVSLTGVAPFMYAQLLPATGPASLLVAAFLIRAFAIDRFDPIPVRLSRALVVTVCLVTVVGLALTVSFGVTHPLWAVKGSSQVSGRQLSFSLRNAGFGDVTILRASRVARTGFASWKRRPVAGLVVPARGSRWITLLNGGCRPVELTVRYLLRGHSISAHLRVIPPEAQYSSASSGC